MASHAGGHVPGYKPAVTNGGWGFALFICVLTAALWVGAWLTHRATYHDPFDPLTAGSETNSPGAHHAKPAPGAEGAAHGGGH